MTEVDKIYGAITGDMKKYGVDHSVSALHYYITEGNSLGFTSDDNARNLISEMTPSQVLEESLRGILKYQIIAKEKELPRQPLNEQEILKTIYQYQHGEQITTNLSSYDLETLVVEMLDGNIDDLLNMFSENKQMFKDYLNLYTILLCNYKNDMNKIDNSNFFKINDYFRNLELEVERDRQR